MSLDFTLAWRSHRSYPPRLRYDLLNQRSASRSRDPQQLDEPEIPNKDDCLYRGSTKEFLTVASIFHFTILNPAGATTFRSVILVAARRRPLASQLIYRTA